ncbi:MAG: ATP-grasp domain-containing protein [Bacteroidales bacterium]|nr:ATP-grasp domain-containing protein [Bacteroidales bacterium]
MFLIDKPYVSDFLINTIRDNNYKIVSTKEAKELISDESLNWISEKDAINIIEKEPDTSIYLNSENAIAWILKNPESFKLSNQIHLFKDKIKFRELIKDSFPDFFYKTVELEDIQELSLDGINFPFVIKPSLGFFSLGVHIVRNIAEWNAAKNELNFNTLQSIYPKEVLNPSTFIIEEYIEGEEYAVDCYFNTEGEVVILNILHHKFSSGTDISDRVYSTSKEIIYKYKNAIEEFLQPIGDKTGLRNFPAHVEIRIDANGQICPIEVNPLRYGGLCTTGDLSWYAFGINSYDYFINNKKPNWEQIFKNRSDKKYSIVILDNNSGFTSSEITHFDYDLLTQDFENVLILRKLDIKKYPVFGFVFTETSKDNEEELNEILISNLTKYISTE